MGTYNIYGYNNGEDNDEPQTVVELNEDDTEIVNITSRDSKQQEEDEIGIQSYVKMGFSPLGAIKRYAGSYGQVWNADRTGGTEQ